jgi:hypothetical protein
MTEYPTHITESIAFLHSQYMNIRVYCAVDIDRKHHIVYYTRNKSIYHSQFISYGDEYHQYHIPLHSWVDVRDFIEYIRQYKPVEVYGSIPYLESFFLSAPVIPKVQSLRPKNYEAAP